MGKKTKQAAALQDDDSQEVIRELASRQQFGRAPKRIADILSRLIARKGYGRLQASDEFQRAWAEAVGSQLAELSRPGNVRRGILEVTVRNSTVAQELQFNKQQVLVKLQSLVTNSTVRDIRFRVGVVD